MLYLYYIRNFVHNHANYFKCAHPDSFVWPIRKQAISYETIMVSNNAPFSITV